MARLLANSTACPLLVPGKPRRCVKTMYCLQAPVLRIQSFSGLRVSNALDLTASPGQDLFLKVNLTVSSRKGKASRCVTRAMFERFTEKAIKVIILSQEEARRLEQKLVGTDHILLGLIGEGTGIAARVLTSMGITLEDAREEVEKITAGRGRGRGDTPVEIPFTLLAKRALELSLEEAGHDDVGPEHLLLGLLREEIKGVAARVLENLGGDDDYIRMQVISIVRDNIEFASYDD